MVDGLADETDVLVIGGGPGGYVTALEAGRAGHDVVLVTDEAPGGTCVHRGCIPSKALLSATRRVQDVTDATAERMGIYADPYIDSSDLFAWKDDLVAALSDGVVGRCRANGVKVVIGHASFQDPHTALVESDDGQGTIAFDNAVVATGSRPTALSSLPFDDELIIDSRQALSLASVLNSLVIVGGGYIGMERAFVFARLGTAVTVVEALQSALPGFDPEITGIVVEHAEALGVEFHFGERAEEYTRTGDSIHLSTGMDSYAGDAVLVAVGREPVADTVDLNAAGIERTDDGFVDVDASGRTTNDRVFAVGDVTGGKMLAHEAMAEGERVAAVIDGDDQTELGVTPAIVFTDPEIGVVGRSVTSVEEEAGEYLIGTHRFAASGRAMAAGERAGFARLVTAGADGRIVGAQVVCRDASELISEATLAIQQRLTVADLAATIHPHPTFSEAWAEAARDVLESGTDGTR